MGVYEIRDKKNGGRFRQMSKHSILNLGTPYSLLDHGFDYNLCDPK